MPYKKMSYKEYTFSFLERKIENPRIRMSYPEIQGLPDQELQRKINEKIQDVVYKIIWNQGFDKEPRLLVEGSSQITLGRQEFLSILFRLRFRVTEISFTRFKIKSLTLNLRNGDIYKLDDLFKRNCDYLSRINKIIHRQIIERNILLIKKLKSIDHDQKFYLTADALVIYFPHHEYTPESFGDLEFMIPYKDLWDLAYEKGPLAKMEPQKVTIGEKDNGNTFKLMKEQSLELSLVTNPSTGYTWQYVQKPNPDVLVETRHFILAQSKRPGSPSNEYWIYNTVNVGATSIILQYSRSWSKEPPLKTFQVNIVVS